MGLDVEKRFRSVLADARALEPDAYFLTGDFCAHEPQAGVYDRLKNLLGDLGVPVCITAGNHDSREMLRHAFDLGGAAQDPIYYHRQIGGRSFLFLDTSMGIVDDAQLDWLSDRLAAYPESEIVMHHPPVQLGIPFMDGKYPLRGTERLHEILTADGVTRRIFCGHYHSVRVVTHRNLQVYLCPPTSFFIDARAEEFLLRERNPAYHYLEWTDDGDFRCANIVVAA